jgi:cohesin complex subunit SA-1/2
VDELLGGRAARHLRASYREMWDKVVREAAHAGALRDGFLLDRAVNLVIALSTSVVRDFRRAATLTAAQLAASCLHVAASLGEARDTAARQAAAEGGARGAAGRAGGGAAARAAAFRAQVDDASSAIADLLAFVDSIFQSVFTARFRDVDPEVRHSVVEGLGRWMLLLPASFLSSAYLKYVAWALSDRDAGVRGAAAAALLAVYATPGNAAQLGAFTDRFAARFEELMDDVDVGVAVHGVRLVTLLSGLGQLPPAAGAKVYRLMSDASPPLRAAAAELVAGALGARGAEALAAADARAAARGQGRGRKGGTAKGKAKGGASTSAAAGAAGRSPEELQLAGVLSVMRMLAADEARAARGARGAAADDDEGAGGEEEEAEQLPLSEKVVCLVVGALHDRAPALRNWQLLADWLRTDAAADALGPAAPADLARALLASVRRAAGADAPPPAPGRSVAAKQRAAWATARQEATLVLHRELPALVRRFQADPEEVAAVMGLIPELALEVYSLRRQEKALASLLASARDVLFMHADAEVAAACVAALCACAAQGTDAARDGARLALGECVARAAPELEAAVAAVEAMPARALAAAARAHAAAGGDDEGAELFALRAALTRAGALLQAGAHGAAASGVLRDALSRLLEVAAGGAPLPASLLAAGARAALLPLLQDLADLTAPDAAAPPSAAALGELGAAVSVLGTQLEAAAAVAAQRGDAAARAEAAAVLGDLMAVFGPEALPEEARDCAYRPSDAAVAAFWETVAAPAPVRDVRRATRRPALP